MYLLRNRFDTVMKYEAQRFEKNYAESSTLGINVSHGHKSIGHFTVIDGSEAEGDLVLIQTFFALLWKLFLKNNS